MRLLRIDEPKDPILREVSAVIPDDWIDDQWPIKSRYYAARYKDYRTSQMVRVHLLAMLKHLSSLNSVSQELSHNIDWRRFCRLRASDPTPAPSTLTKFRHSFGWAGWRELHVHLLHVTMKVFGTPAIGVIVADATDLPAALKRTWKKKGTPVFLND